MISASAQKQQPQSHHFRWSERSTHELDYNHTLRTARDIPLADRHKLARAVLQQLRKNPEVAAGLQDLTPAQLNHLVQNTRIELLDLNGDGKPEFIAQANGFGPCAGTGNCIFWIFESTPTGLKALLDTSSKDERYEKIALRPWATNGYRDIVLGSHSSAVARNLVWYQFRAGAYHKHACYFWQWLLENRKSPDIAQVPCQSSH